MANRDQYSVSVDPVFQSVLGSSADFLKYDIVQLTPLENGGVPISGINTDFSGTTTRDANFPDIGAWELPGRSLDGFSPVISLSPIPNSCPGTYVLTATITDPSGVPTSGSGLPRLFYSVNGGAYVPVTGTFLGTGQYSFTFSSGSTSGETISYYLVAQDNASTPNVGAFPSAGTSSLTTSPPAAGTPPTAPLSFTTITAAALSTTAVAVASPLVVCQGSNTTLTMALSRAGSAVVGLGSSTSSSSSSSPFYHGYGGVKTQYIIRSSELSASGLSAGTISAVSLNITTLGTATLNQFSISLGHTSQSQAVANTAIVSGLTTVYTNSAQTLALGVNSFSFSSPFNWDGVSNIVLTFCYTNNNAGGTSSVVSVDPQSYTSSLAIFADNVSSAATCLIPAVSSGQACMGTNSNSTSTSRPRFVFDGNVPPLPSSYSWSNGASVVGATNPLSVPVTFQTGFTGTATINGCLISASTSTVTVNPLPASPTINNNITQCGDRIPSVFLTHPLSAGSTSPTFNWYSSATATSTLQSSTSNSYAGIVTTTTTLFASVVSPTTLCESPRVPITVTVTAANPITAAASTSTISCLGGSVNLSVSQTGTAQSYALTWSATTSAATSGLTGTVTATLNTPLTVTPTAPGTYNYRVTGIDGDCQAVSNVSVVVNNPLSGITATATASP
ncbi:MAG: hypothetical protein ACK420_01190, partial [Sphingomonadales bacterium]